MWQLWERFWFFDDNARFDSAIAVCQKMIEVGGPMMEFRYDSTIYEKHAMGFGGMGVNLMRKGRLEEGFLLAQKSWDLLHDKFGEYQPRNSELCSVFMEYYIAKGDFDQALYYCDKSLKIRRNAIPGPHYYEGNIYGNFANTYLMMGDLDKAIEYYQKALDNYRLTNPYAMAYANHYLSNAYLLAKDYQKAIAYAQTCIRLATEDQPWKNQGFTRFPTGKEQTEWHYFDLPAVYVLLGSAYRETGEFQKSLDNLNTGIEQSLGQWEKSGNVAAFGWFEKGKTYVKMNEMALAMDAFRKVGPVLEKYAGGGENLAAEAWNEAAQLQLLLNHPDSAVFYFQKALHVFSPEFPEENRYQNAPLESLTPAVVLLGALERKARALYVLYHKSNEASALAASLETYTLAADLTDNLRHNYKWQDSKQNLSGKALPIFEGAVETSLGMHQLTSKTKYEVQALGFIERSKAFTLTENLQSEKARSFGGIAPELLRKEDAVNREIDLYQRFLLEENLNTYRPDTEKLTYWRDKLIDLKKSQDSLLAIFEKNYPEYHRLKYRNLIAIPAQIQRKLKENETLIEYFLGDSSLYTFAINHAGFQYHQRKTDSTLFNAVNRLRQFAKTPNKGASWTTSYRQYVADARYLYQVLLEPALDVNSSSLVPLPSSLVPHPSSLIIIPDGILGYLPFNLLLTKEPDPVMAANYSYRGLPYLVNDTDLRYEYSATLMLESRNLSSKAGNRWPRSRQTDYCGFAPSYGDGEAIASRGEEDSLKLADIFTGLARGKLSALRFTQPEIKEASATMQGKAFEAEAATEAEFKRQAGEAEILHLAMHALTNDQEPLFSQLVFAQDDGDTTEDGRLHAYELQNMKLKADLAVLSACNTGAGKLQRGEGVMSLSRAFKFAGVPNVVMSLWQADDLSTKTIVGDFFKNLKSGMGKDRALCQAQRTFIASVPDQYLTHPYYWSTLMLVGDGESITGNRVPDFLLIAGILLLLTGLSRWGWVVTRNKRVGLKSSVPGASISPDR
jgi:CHAT domain-containing protein